MKAQANISAALPRRPSVLRCPDPRRSLTPHQACLRRLDGRLLLTTRFIVIVQIIAARIAPNDDHLKRKTLAAA